MSTYYINIENTGLETDEQVAAMAIAMQADGHDVEPTTNFGSVNREPCPVSDSKWFEYIEAAAQ